MLFGNSSSSFTSADIQELYHLLPISQLGKVLKHGLLSQKRTNCFVEPASAADRSIQSKRARLRIMRADGTKQKLSLHEHVGLFINPHNAAMYVRTQKGQSAEDFCVLRIRKAILNRGDAVVKIHPISASFAWLWCAVS